MVKGTAPGMVTILKRHFDPSVRMLERVLAVCPDELWEKDTGVGFPFWQQLFHVIFYIDYWLREDYAAREFRSVVFAKRLSPDLGTPSPDSLTRAETKDYLARVVEKTDHIFASLDDAKLSLLIRPRGRITYHDAILGQIRHIQHHVGNANSLLRRAGARTAGWRGYGEE